ncbi:hypothetical protein [Saccharothrix longispora]|nr:hypothetical protein [Saccharothrix longispora]MDU0294474.1 hypothetical protein [Saccharothrix longispora]
MFVFAMFIAAAAGYLTYKATSSVPSALLAAFPAFAATVYFADKITE